MTSAARPTWSAALSSGGGLRDGSSAAPTLQTCAKDQRGHLKLKMRQLGQDAPEELKKRNLKAELSAVALITGDSDEEIEEVEQELTLLIDEKDVENEKEAISADDGQDEDDLDDDDEDDDNDDEEELMKELEKIKREREAERLARERKEAESNPHAILAGNPLLASTSFGVKRRWDDDVVFKNQARNVDDKPQKRFINDTTRSDFHKRFLDKFIK